MNKDARIAFRDQLREARTQAINDAEAYDQLLFAFERLGCFLKGSITPLGKLKKKLLCLANESALAQAVPCRWRECHVPASQLFEHIREARNDAMHHGAFARHLTTHSVQFAIILEDALMSSQEREADLLVGDLMVRDPVCASLWQPISYIRQQMLSNSFSYLPVLESGKWHLVSDLSIAKYLRVNPAQKAVKLAMPLSQAISDGLTMEKAECFDADSPIANAIQRINHHPALICRKGELELVGILTAFDLL